MSTSGYENWLIRNGRQTKTITAHLKKLNVLNRFLTDWTEDQVNNFIVTMKKSGKKNATINAYIDTVRSYSQFLGLSETLKRYKYFPKEQTVKGVLTDTEVEKLVNMPCPARCYPKTWDLDSKFLKLIAYSGARPNEIAMLTKADITPECFIIRKSKNKKPRLVPLAEPIRDEIMDFVNKLDRDKLFVTSRGKNYTDDNWQHIWERRANLLGINRTNVSLYSLRHSMATELYRRKVPAQIIAKLLGNSIEMVEKTYAHMVLDDVAEALRQHPLIGKRSSTKDVLNDLVKGIKKYGFENDPRFKYILQISNDGVRLDIRIGQIL